MTQFQLDYMFINIFSHIEPVPYKIEIKFNDFQKNRIIEVLSTLRNTLFSNDNKTKKPLKQEKNAISGTKSDEKNYSNRKAYNEALYNQEKMHLLYDTIIRNIKEGQPLNCKQFQGLCGAIIESSIDRENPTPNEKNIVHLISVAGGVLFDLNKLSTEELDKWVMQKNNEIINYHIKKALNDYLDTL